MRLEDLCKCHAKEVHDNYENVARLCDKYCSQCGAKRKPNMVPIPLYCEDCGKVRFEVHSRCPLYKEIKPMTSAKLMANLFGKDVHDSVKIYRGNYAND